MSEQPGTELSTAAKAAQASQPIMAIVWRLIGGTIFGVVVGYWIDQMTGWSPWCLLGGSVIGMSVGMYAFIVGAMRLGNK